MVTSESAAAIDCENTLLRAEDPQQLVGIGLSDLIAVAMPKPCRATIALGLVRTPRRWLALPG